MTTIAKMQGDFVERANRIAHTKKRGRVRLDHILEAVCKTFEVSSLELVSPSRMPYLCYARHAYAWIAYSVSGHSCRQIANHIHRGDHSTVINSVRRASAAVQRDPDYADKINEASRLADKLAAKERKATR
jgi:chromosomal replication initiation ATPase DnaA